MGTECEGIRVSNCISKSEIREAAFDDPVRAEEWARSLTLVLEPMHCTTQPSARRDLR